MVCFTGSILPHLFIWLLLAQLHHASSPYSCDSCGDKCWKCLGSTEVPRGLESDLEILYLSDNVLNSITGKYFSTYKNIRELHLSNCSLKALPTDTFSYLDDLEFVDLSHNKISETLPETVFQANANLHEVILNYNTFSRIETPFLSSGSIRILSMIGCKITELSSESFKHLPRLEELNLEKNMLMILPPNLFTTLKFFSKLFIDRNTVAANEPFQSCTPGLRVFVGEEIRDCDAVKSEITTDTTYVPKFLTDQTVAPPDVKSHKNKTMGLTTTTDTKYTERTTSSFSISMTQLSTNENKRPTKSTVSTPTDTKEPTETFPNLLTEIVEIKTIYLILLTVILFTILIFCLSLCICIYFSLRRGTPTDYPNFDIDPPGDGYDHLIHSTENCYTPRLQQHRCSHGPVQTSPVVPQHTHQTDQLYASAGQISDHIYQEITCNCRIVELV